MRHLVSARGIQQVLVGFKTKSEISRSIKGAGLEAKNPLKLSKPHRSLAQSVATRRNMDGLGMSITRGTGAGFLPVCKNAVAL